MRFDRLAVRLAAALLVVIPADATAQSSPPASGFSVEDDTRMVRAILARIDADVTDTDIYAEDVVHMAQGSRAITSRAELRRVLLEEANHGRSTMTHELVTLHSTPDFVLTRGRVTGSWRPAAGGAPMPFETNNMITFRRAPDGSLKVWQVIFNRVDLARYESAQPAPPPDPAQANPFARFFGEWTLKDDRFQQVWDGKTVETLTIPNHHTRCAPVNTARSVLCVVTTPDLAGHILWTYDDARSQVHHLSHFGTARNGSGSGSFSDRGDLRTRIRFSDEPEGSYRVYEYRWVSDDEYTMLSRQYDRDGKPTGNWYGGSFVRIGAAP